MSVFATNSRYLREVLSLCFYLMKIHGEVQCCEWFQRFKSSDVSRRPAWRWKRENLRRFELEALLAENSCKTQEELSELLKVAQQAIPKRLIAMKKM